MEAAHSPRAHSELELDDSLERHRQLERFIDGRIAVNPGSIALVAVDLERLKEINDAYGHSEGTAYIQNALEVIQCYIRSSTDDSRSADTLFTGQAVHTSGDEFWVILEDVSEQSGVDAFIERVQQALDDLGTGAAFGGRVHIPGESAAQLIEDADKLMRRNKVERVPALSQDQEERFLGAVATLNELDISPRSVALYLEAISSRRQERG